MGKVYKVCLAERDIYSCTTCGTHFSKQDDLVSKSFLGVYGRAFLFEEVVNVNMGPIVKCVLTTGTHTTREVYCLTCCDYVGWRYVEAFEDSQKYKEGKYILEKAKIIRRDAADLRTD